MGLNLIELLVGPVLRAGLVAVAIGGGVVVVVGVRIVSRNAGGVLFPPVSVFVGGIDALGDALAGIAAGDGPNDRADHAADDGADAGDDRPDRRSSGRSCQPAAGRAGTGADRVRPGRAGDRIGVAVVRLIGGRVTQVVPQGIVFGCHR